MAIALRPQIYDVTSPYVYAEKQTGISLSLAVHRIITDKWSKNFVEVPHRREFCTGQIKHDTRLLLRPANRNAGWQQAGKSRRHIPQKCPFPWETWTHLMHTSLGPSESTSQKVSWFSRFGRVHGRYRQTDRLTDHATPSVAIGCIYLVLQWWGLKN